MFLFWTGRNFASVRCGHFKKRHVQGRLECSRHFRGCW